ncbi:MAG: hypothetical protein QM760_10545 [Nibricoccus sp.]
MMKSRRQIMPTKPTARGVRARGLRAIARLRDFERFSKLHGGFGFPAELEVEFSEENTRHHPVGLFGDAEFEVVDGVDEAVLGDKRLGEAEAEEFVVGLAGDQRSESLRAFGRSTHAAAENLT